MEEGKGNEADSPDNDYGLEEPVEDVGFHG
jgi:hypothetical protein